MAENVEGVILLLLREGSNRHAIRLYQEETGAQFTEAKQAVYALARKHGIRIRSMLIGPLGSLVLVVLSGLIGTMLC